MNGSGKPIGARVLTRNTLFNLAGEAVPLLAALLAVPIVVRALGAERYGILSLIIMVIGYFGMFDLGLDLAATKFIAEAAASGRQSEIPHFFWGSLFLMSTLGTIAGLLVALLAPWLVDSVFKVPPALRPESVRAFYLLALSMPFIISVGSLTGTLAAFQRFDLINSVRIPIGVCSYLAPLFVLLFSRRLEWLVTVMVASRFASWLIVFPLCLRVIPELSTNKRFGRSAVWPMLRFGGWTTLSDIVGPIMVFFDRFLIGSVLSIAAVAYYSAPYQLITKLGVVSVAIGGVVFAAFAGTFSQDPGRAALLFERATKYVLLALFLPVLFVVAFAPEVLNLLFGADFAQHSAGVLRWLAIGVFVSNLAWTPCCLVQAASRPDLTAKLHVFEVPFYIAALLWALPRFGIEGAAAAWTFRAAADAVIMFMFARRVLPAASNAINRIGKTAFAAIFVFVVGAAAKNVLVKSVYLGLVLPLFAISCFTILLEPQERTFLWHQLRIARTLAFGKVQ